jgi:hypothetical protein
MQWTTAAERLLFVFPHADRHDIRQCAAGYAADLYYCGARRCAAVYTEDVRYAAARVFRANTAR